MKYCAGYSKPRNNQDMKQVQETHKHVQERKHGSTSNDGYYEGKVDATKAFYFTDEGANLSIKMSLQGKSRLSNNWKHKLKLMKN